MFRSLLLLVALSCLFSFSSAAVRYQNVVASQTECTAKCNGVTTRTYACVDTTTGLPVDSSKCPTAIATVNCNYCPSVFVISDWSPCTSACATPESTTGGTQTRQPVCRLYSQTLASDSVSYFGYTFTLSSNPATDCGSANSNGVPSYNVQTRSCNTGPCVGTTYIEKLVSSSCTGACNQPAQTYQQICVNGNGNPIDAKNCDNLLLAGWIQGGGTINRNCPNYVPCATSLVLSQFGVCSKPCNGGVFSRTLTCHNWNPTNAMFTDSVFTGFDSTTGAAKFQNSDGTAATVDSTCSSFSDITRLTTFCNTQKCTSPFVFQCTAWGLNYPVNGYKATRTCTCQDSNTGAVRADQVCIDNKVDKPLVETYDLASVGLTANTLVVTDVGACNARCTIAGGVKPTRTRTYNCLNINGQYATGNSYTSWVTNNPECAVPGAANLPSNQQFPIVVTETCNTDLCTDVTWAITFTPTCPKQCGNTNQFITRTVQCVSLGTGLPTSESSCPSIAKPATTVLCNTQACSYSWQSSEWTTCSQPCVPQSYFTSGAITNSFYIPPTQTRTVTCVSQDGTVDNTGASCPAAPAIPATSRRCNFFACQESLQVVYRTNCLTGNAKCVAAANQMGTKYADCIDPFGNVIPTDVTGQPAKACRDLYPNTVFTPATIQCKDYVPVCATSLMYPTFGVCSQKCTPRKRLANGKYELGTVGTRIRGLPTCIGTDGVTTVTLDQCTTVDALNAQGYRQASGALLTSTASNPTTYQSQICNVDVCPDVVMWQVNQDQNGKCLNPTCVDAFGTQVNYKMCLDRVDTIGPVPTCPTVIPTYSWLYGVQPYGSCSKTCGGGIQTRNILCTLADGVTQSSNNAATDPTVGCGPVPVPAIPNTQKCNTQPCIFAVKTVPQVSASCSLSCGGGTVRSTPTCVNTINGNSESILSCVKSGVLGAGDCNGGLTTRADGTYDWSTCVINAPCNPQACDGVSGSSNTYYQWVTNPWNSCHCPASNLERVSRTVSCYQYSSVNPPAFAPVSSNPANCDANSKPAEVHNCPAKDIGCAGPITYAWRLSFPDCTNSCGASVSTLVYCAGFQMGQSTLVDDSLCANAGARPSPTPFTCTC